MAEFNHTAHRIMLFIPILLVGIIEGMEISKGGLQSSLPIKSQKTPKFLNLITWVQFDNTECAGTSGDNGTCFTSNECSEIGGKADGTCATGFGVCCVLQVDILSHKHTDTQTDTHKQTKINTTTKQLLNYDRF